MREQGETFRLYDLGSCLTSKEAAAALSLSERRIRQLLEEGRISGATQFSGVWVIPVPDSGVPMVLPGRAVGRPRLAERTAS